MILNRRIVLASAMGALLTACGAPPVSKFRRYDGPQVTRVQVFKRQRRMQLLSGNRMLKEYVMQMGFAPEGHKQIENDGRTPEGAYRIDRRNRNSRYHLSIGISYPNSDDIARAEAMGKQPGGDIFIHGTPTNYIGQNDWTWGCIAVSNGEIEEIYAMVKDGTAIFIYP